MQKRMGPVRVLPLFSGRSALHSKRDKEEVVMVRVECASFVLVCALSACGGSGAPLAVSSRPSSRAVTAGSLQWLGGPSVLLERGGLRVLTDPMLGPRGERAFVLPKHPSTGEPDAAIARYTEPAAVSLSNLSAILISHTHADHVDGRAKESLPKEVPVVVAASGAEAMRAAGFRDVRPLDWGESVTLERAGAALQVTAVPAHHAHEATLDREIGRGNGYVLTFRDAHGLYRVYWTGDAVLAEESRQLVAEHGPIDLLLPHMGGVGGDGGRGLRTMNAEEAIELVSRIAPRVVVPIHHTTFGRYREPIEALEERARETGELARFRFVRLGENLALGEGS